MTKSEVKELLKRAYNCVSTAETLEQAKAAMLVLVRKTNEQIID